MADKLESLDESFASRLKEEVRRQFEAAGFTVEQAQAALDRIGKIQTAPAWDRINTPRLGALREDNPPILGEYAPNPQGKRRTSFPVVNMYLTEEQLEDFSRGKGFNDPGGIEAIPNVHAPFQTFVDQHPDEIARLSPDEFQLLGLLFKTKGGERAISLYNQSKQ